MLYMLISGDLYKLGRDEVLRSCVLEHERLAIMEELHGGCAGVHYAGDATAHKVIMVGLWWETLYKDCKDYCKVCDHCQRIGKPRRRDKMPLHPIPSTEPFKKWEINFVGPITPAACRTGSCYVITCMDYLTRWAEAAPTNDCTVATMERFLWENIITRHGCSLSLTSYRGTHFLNETVRILLAKFMVAHHKTTPYHP